MINLLIITVIPYELVDHQEEASHQPVKKIMQTLEWSKNLEPKNCWSKRGGEQASKQRRQQKKVCKAKQVKQNKQAVKASKKVSKNKDQRKQAEQSLQSKTGKQASKKWKHTLWLKRVICYLQNFSFTNFPFLLWLFKLNLNKNGKWPS